MFRHQQGAFSFPELRFFREEHHFELLSQCSQFLCFIFHNPTKDYVLKKYSVALLYAMHLL
jgi:hypothetical protein